MKQVKVQYAKTHLSALLAAVERGEEFIIARGDHPAARLVPMEPRQSRELGFVAYSVPDEFLDALPDEELAAWEGNGWGNCRRPTFYSAPTQSTSIGLAP